MKICVPKFETFFYFEKVAIAFWKAIGGDEDEIGDLDSDGWFMNMLRPNYRK